MHAQIKAHDSLRACFNLRASVLMWTAGHTMLDPAFGETLTLSLPTSLHAVLQLPETTALPTTKMKHK